MSCKPQEFWDFMLGVIALLNSVLLFVVTPAIVVYQMWNGEILTNLSLFVKYLISVFVGVWILISPYFIKKIVDVFMEGLE